MHKQQEKVTKPLIAQLIQYKQDQDKRVENQNQMAQLIRILVAILRFPSLSDQFRKISDVNYIEEEKQ